MTVLAVSGWAALHSVTRDYQDAAEEATNEAVPLIRLDAMLSEIGGRAYPAVQTGGDGLVRFYERGADDLDLTFAELLGAARFHEERAELELARQEWILARDLIAGILAQPLEERGGVSAGPSMMPVWPHIGLADGALDRATDISLADVAKEMDRADGDRRAVQGRVGRGLVIGMAVAVLAGWWLRRSVLVPVRRLTAATERLRHGELSHRVALTRSDELGELGDAFDHMAVDLEAGLRRDRVLTAAGFAVARASDRDAVASSAAAAGLDLVDDLPGSRVTMSLGTLDRMEIVAATGEGAEAAVGVTFSIDEVPAGLRASLLAHEMGSWEGLRDDERLHREGFTSARAGIAIPIDVEGELRGLLSVATDHAVQARSESALRTLAHEVGLALHRIGLADDLVHREARFRALVEHSADVTFVVDATGGLLSTSEAAGRVLGYDTIDPPGHPAIQVVHELDHVRAASFIAALADEPGKSDTIEVRVRHADGTYRWCEVVVTNMLERPEVGGLVAHLRDITDRRALEDELAHQAFHDLLTGLANRALVLDRIDHATARRTGSAEVGVLFVDLDGFKRINDSLGHAIGDQVLVEAARRLAATAGAGDTLGRLGGDEFVLVVEDVVDFADLEVVAKRVLGVLRLPFLTDAGEVSLSASVGIARAGEVGSEDLVRDADVAMYAAKRAGKDRIAFFESAMHEAVSDRLELETALRHALEQGELSVAYQPEICIEDGCVTAVEALLRWQHPVRGAVAPDVFIPIAEECGLIHALGAFVLDARVGRCASGTTRPSAPTW